MTPASPVRIRVPASAANLGPGYDSFGLALGSYDEVIAARADTGLSIQVRGVGAGQVPTDERHLVVQAALRAFAAMGEPAPGLRLDCTNTIPHGGGQGSSAAAIVAGVLLARALTPGGDDRLPDAAVFALATDMEGHPDNVAPALFGGFTVAWTGAARGGATAARAVRLTPHADLQAVVLSAEASCATATARAALPALIPHAEAAANSARAALLVHAMTSEPDLLLDATEDYLHQRYREAVMPASAELLRRLRGRGIAAVLSGAGPSVLALGTDLPDPANWHEPGFSARRIAIPAHGAEVDGRPFPADAAARGVAVLRETGRHR